MTASKRNVRPEIRVLTDRIRKIRSLVSFTTCTVSSARAALNSSTVPTSLVVFTILDSSFDVYNVAVSGGTESAAELRAGDFLEVVEFSDFQVDDITGDIAGEIRLAYLHRDGRVTPVSGGSVSGSMPELAKTMRFSKESRQYNCHLIPAVTRLQGVTITGAE